VTLFLDAAKGALGVQLAAMSWHYSEGDYRSYVMAATAALFAVVGHMFPVWLKFRGGKGVATALGAFLRLSPGSVLVAFIIFILVLFIGRRISLGSIVTAAFFPVVVSFFLPPNPAVLALIAATAVLIIVRHHQNIRRLLSGQEPRFSIGRK
jgi:glycerol-3-phosphate acyltransferase PlsY